MRGRNNVKRAVIRTAKRLGFFYERTAKHGEIWRHSLTNRTVMLGRAANHGDWRTLQNLIHDLQRAAATGGA